jgi:hypothetical protein
MPAQAAGSGGGSWSALIPGQPGLFGDESGNPGA